MSDGKAGKDKPVDKSVKATSGFDTGPVKVILIKFIENQTPGVVKRVYFRTRPNGTSGGSDIVGYFPTTIADAKKYYDLLIADFVSAAVGSINLTLDLNPAQFITNTYQDSYTFPGPVEDTISMGTPAIHVLVTKVT